MAHNLLADTAIKAALKAALATGKETILDDGDGLTLIARPDGAGWWQFRYWLDRRENRLSFGVYKNM